MDYVIAIIFPLFVAYAFYLGRSTGLRHAPQKPDWYWEETAKFLKAREPAAIFPRSVVRFTPGISGAELDVNERLEWQLPNGQWHIVPSSRWRISKLEAAQ